MIGNVIESRFFQVVDYPTAAALSFMLMAAILAGRRSTSGGPGRRSWCERDDPRVRRGRVRATRTACRRAPARVAARRRDHPASCSSTCSCRSPTRSSSRSTTPASRTSAGAASRSSNWTNPCGAPGVCDALGNSLKIGLLATVVATVLGTMIAFALARHRFRGRSRDQPADLPADGHARGRAGRAPADVSSSSTCGVQLGLLRRSSSRTSCSASASSSSRSRRGWPSLDPRLEQAAMDLYANPTADVPAGHLPAGRCRASSRRRCWRSPCRFDDFIITNFNSGDTTTFPKFVYVSDLRGIPAQANVIGFSDVPHRRAAGDPRTGDLLTPQVVRTPDARSTRLRNVTAGPARLWPAAPGAARSTGRGRPAARGRRC